MTSEMLHATAVAIAGNAVLLIGPSGSGKSDLALRLIDRGAKLVSDDAVAVATDHSGPVLSAAPNIEGFIEVRGVGICSVESMPSAPLRMVVTLSDEIERLPKDSLTSEICGYNVPMVNLPAFENSTALKVEFALRRVVDEDRWPMAKNTISQPEGSSC
jgi:serine kinase of HPr protein (carbohydrate metabolism regulator)